MRKTKSTVDNSVLGMLDSDLIFSMKASTNGQIVTHGINVFVKDKNGWQQVGLIHGVRMTLKANVPQPGIEVEFESHPKLPVSVKRFLTKAKSDLKDLGVYLKRPKK